MSRYVANLIAAMGVAALGSGCPLDDDGGGGGGGATDFVRGFAFVRGDQNVYAADESDLQDIAQLTSGGGARHPSLSPDALSVVFVADNAIQRVALSGGSPATLYAAASGQSRLANPVYSPDGSRVVFTFERGGSSVLAVVNADGTGYEEITSSAASHGSPSFYPDGVHVLAAFGSGTTSFTQLEKINIDTRAVQNLGSVGAGLATLNRVVISPDGTRAAFDATVATGSRIFVIGLGGASSTPTQLTDYPADPTARDTFPTWMSSNEVAFSSDVGGNDQVYRLPASAEGESGALVLPSAKEPWFGPL